MTIFKRYATVAYDARNLSILSIEGISDASVVEYHPEDLRQIFTAALTPHLNATSDDTELTNALLYQLGFILRLYQDNFRDAKDVALDLLRGFLTVPIQFSTLVWVYVNATTPPTATGPFPLPADFETTASAAQVTYRALVTPWFVFVFIAVAGFLLIWSTSIFGYTLLQKSIPPNTSPFPEVDIGAKALYCERESGNEVGGYSVTLQESNLHDAEAGRIVQVVRGHAIRLGEHNGG
jgi:hypothetical protein